MLTYTHKKIYIIISLKSHLRFWPSSLISEELGSHANDNFNHADVLGRGRQVLKPMTIELCMNQTKEKKKKKRLQKKKKEWRQLEGGAAARKPGSVQSGSIEKSPAFSLLLLSVIASRCSFAVGPTNG